MTVRSTVHTFNFNFSSNSVYNFATPCSASLQPCRPVRLICGFLGQSGHHMVVGLWPCCMRRPALALSVVTGPWPLSRCTVFTTLGLQNSSTFSIRFAFSTSSRVVGRFPLLRLHLVVFQYSVHHSDIFFKHSSVACSRHIWLCGSYCEKIKDSDRPTCCDCRPVISKTTKAPSSLSFDRPASFNH